jgi:putative ABC transport system permease protein
MAKSIGVSLAWQNLTHDRWRFAVFSAGIGFAVVLMFVQNGFRNALLDSNVILHEKLNADLIIVSRQESSLAFRETISLRRLAQAAGVEGVRSVHPLYVEYFRSVLRIPDPANPGIPSRPIRVLGIDPDAYLLDLPELNPAPGSPRSLAAELKQDGRALFDRRSRPNPERPSEPIFGPLRPGVETDLAGRRIRVVGYVELGSDFAAEGTLIVNTDTFVKLLRRPYTYADPYGEVEIGLVRLVQGADRAVVQERIRATMPEGDVTVLTRDELIEREKRFWLDNTPIGFVFGLGMMMGFVVGTVICYQILSSEVMDHLAEYATLKAIGYPNRYLSKVVLQQALVMAGSGFVLGLFLSSLLYSLLAWATGLPMRFTPGRVGLILVLTVVMCVLSGLLALRKVQEADPAEVF